MRYYVHWCRLLLTGFLPVLCLLAGTLGLAHVLRQATPFTPAPRLSLPSNRHPMDMRMSRLVSVTSTTTSMSCRWVSVSMYFNLKWQ